LGFDGAFGSAEAKGRIELVSRINKDGVLRVISQRTRSQEMNRTDALERFVDLLKHALTPERRDQDANACRRQRTANGRKEKRTVIKETRSKKGWDS